MIPMDNKQSLNFSNIGSLSINTKDKFLSTFRRINSFSNNEKINLNIDKPISFNLSKPKLVYSEQNFSEKSTNTNDLDNISNSSNDLDSTICLNDISPFDEDSSFLIKNNELTDDETYCSNDEQNEFELCDDHRKFQNLLHLLENLFKKNKPKSKESRKSEKLLANFINKFGCLRFNEI
ncbi:unnamed protein product [Brachionus calyciflorus]|uniref:Uncharacterized protein n=1 Tax=Brachionus calyciflorus TaxID=104777 RepID=A0A813UC25_9BILA|nr:unnamed protein product [Brachionus calyciflorus]